MAVLVALLALAVTGVSLLLAAVSALAAQRTRAARFGFATAAFLLFAIRGGWIVADGAGWWESPMAWDAWTVGFDAAVVALIYAAVVKE